MDERGKFAWQNVAIIGLVAIIVAFAMGWIGGSDGEIGFATYIKLANGDVIKLEPKSAYTMFYDPATLSLKTASGVVIEEIYQNIVVNPAWGGDVDPADPNAIITYVSHKTTWKEYPSGANLNQVAPLWRYFGDFDAPMNQETEKEYGPRWVASVWSAGSGEPSGEYRVETEMTVEGTYKGSSTQATAYGGLHVFWTKDTLTLSVGWRGYSSFILG